MSDENMVEPAYVEFEDFSDEELSEVLDRANNLLQEVLPVALENDEINEDDIVEYNDMRANNMCYQGAVVPPAYHWEQTGLDQEELMQDYVEVFIAYMQEGAEEPQDGDRIFAFSLASPSIAYDNTSSAFLYITIDLLPVACNTLSSYNAQVPLPSPP